MAEDGDSQDTAVTLPKVSIQEEAPETEGTGIIDKSADTPSTTYNIGRQGLDIYAGPGQTDPYYATSGLPSVNASRIDPYGLTTKAGGYKGLRMRGELFSHGAGGTVEGLPLTAVSPGIGYLGMFDMENFSGVSVSQGPLPPNQLTVYGVPGTLDSSLLWPQMKAGVKAQQSFGSFDFKRSFARLDTGDLGHSTAAFASASWSDADKWRGPGKEADGRTNVETAFTTSPSDKLDMKAYFTYNDTSGYSYRGLTYSQATNLTNYGSYDFTSSPVAGALAYYYKNNRFNFTNYGALAEITYKFTNDTRLIIKPHYVYEDGQFYMQAGNSSTVRNWLINHDYYGISSELQTKLLNTEFKLGHWWMSQEPDGPPKAWKMYTATASGGLTFNSTNAAQNYGWMNLARVTDRHEYQNVYAMADHRFDDLRLQLGGRYVRETLPGMQALIANSSTGDVSYDEAVARSVGVNSDKSVTSFSIERFLPYGSASYDLAHNLQLKVTGGQNYGAPAFDVWNAIQSNIAAFKAAGYANGDQLWHQLKPEITTGVDLGMHWDYGAGYVEPTLFYSKSTHKMVSYDPGIPANVSYGQNVGETHAWGIQAVAHWLPTDDIDVFNSISYNRNVFDATLPTLSTASAAKLAAAQSVKGRQLPDTPVWISSLGVSWHVGDFTFTPVGNLMSSRFADIGHTQRIPAYATLDLNLGYEREVKFGVLTASLAIANVFDKHYISQIDSGYTDSASDSDSKFYPGAPRTIVGRLGLKF